MTGARTGSHAARDACLAAASLVLGACAAPALTSVHALPRPAAQVVTPPPASVDAARAALERARAAWEAGDRSPAVIASFEAAGRALRRHGQPMRAFVATSAENARTTADGRVFVPISDHRGEGNALAVFAVEDAARARAARRAPSLFPRKIVLRVPSGFETTAASDGSVVASSEGGAWLFPSIDRPPLAFPGRARASLDGRGQALVLVSGVDDAAGATAHVVDLVRGVERFARKGASAYEARLDGGGRWLSQCPYHSDERAFVVDAATGKELYASTDDVRACTIDAATARVAVAYDEPGGQRVEVWSLAPPAKVGEAHRKGGAIDSPTVSFGPTDVVELDAAPYKGERKTVGRWDASSMRALPSAARPARPSSPKKAAVRGSAADDARHAIARLPRGAATDGADVASLASLASPGSKLVEPYFTVSAGWAQNGVVSKDGATLALLEDAATEQGEPALLLVDTATLARKQRVALEPAGYQWSTVYFLDDATVVVRLEWSYAFIDVATGALLLQREHGTDATPRSYESPRLLAPDLLAMGPALFDLSRDLRPEGATREVTGAPFLPPEVERKVDGERVTITSGGITATVERGELRVTRGTIPSWIWCEIGDDLYPWPACR